MDPNSTVIGWDLAPASSSDDYWDPSTEGVSGLYAFTSAFAGLLAVAIAAWCLWFGPRIHFKR